MQTRTAHAIWRGTLTEGEGRINIKNLGLEAAYSFASRFENGRGTNPEELIAAAHAGCFSMALANILAGKGYKPMEISTTAQVKLSKGDEGFFISGIELRTEATVPGIEEEILQTLADVAKTGCPVSRALAAVDISLQISLIQRL